MTYGAKRFLGVGITVLFGLFLGGCSGSSLSQLAHTQPTGSPFTASLAQEYLIFASREHVSYFDRVSTSYFARKGLDAAMGVQVQPELVEKWHIPPQFQGELQNARLRLLAILNNANPRANNTSELAQAQVNFDCWIEEQDENKQPENIAFCRNNFYQALMIAEQKNMGPASATLLPTAPYRSYYRPGQTDVPAQAAPVLSQLMSLMSQTSDYKMMIDGYADKTGRPSRNIEVSQQRANKMRDAIVARGAAAFKIQAVGHGDTEAKGKRGTSSVQDRRVDVTLYVPEDYLLGMVGGSGSQSGMMNAPLSPAQVPQGLGQGYRPGLNPAASGMGGGVYNPAQGPYAPPAQGAIPLSQGAGGGGLNQVPQNASGGYGQLPQPQRPAIPLMPLGPLQMMQPRPIS